MKKTLLLLLAVSSAYCFASLTPELHPQKSPTIQAKPIDDILWEVGQKYGYLKTPLLPSNQIKAMLSRTAPTLSLPVINKVLTTLRCANTLNLNYNSILTVIDYSLPSNKKRLWVFNLRDKTLLFHTYVSHGIRSGTLFSNFFSNKNDSKASSIGVYQTEQPYYGRHGVSLKLEGLERGFNDNALNRAVVMHGGWYVEEDFIRKYGRAGRSWGCPAVPDELIKPIINTIKEKSLFVIYYPSDAWFVKSKFQNCASLSPIKPISPFAKDLTQPTADTEFREPILFTDTNKNSKREESEAVAVVSAEYYKRIFHTHVPVERMIRRPINNTEYIALSINEFKSIVTQANLKEYLAAISFIIPVVKMMHGYYGTEMEFVLGKIKDVQLNPPTKNEENETFLIQFERNSMVKLKPTNRFIRWLGL